MQITAAHKRAVEQYYKELAAYHEQDVLHETAVRSAFQNLLAAFAPSVNWLLVPEETLANGKRPDGTLRDTFRLPLLGDGAAFAACVDIGKRLMALHLGYEDAAEYPLQWIENRAAPVNWRVEKMRLASDKTSLLVNDWLTLAGIPPECYRYRLGNRSALEWIIDQYQVSTDKRSGITSDPNRLDDEQYIVRLVGKVVTVSMETVKLVEELAGEVLFNSLEEHVQNPLG